MINKYLHLPEVKKVLPFIVDLAIPLTLVVILVILISATLKLFTNFKRAGLLNKANIILILFWFAVLLAIGGWSTTTSYCSACHVMRAEGMIWKGSSHAQAACYDCHSDKGALGLTYRKLAEFRMIYVTATGKYANPVRSSVPDSRCLSCHKDILKKTAVSKGIKIRHSDFAVKTWRCYECHITTAHGAAVPVTNPPVMTRCVTCHDGGRASAECETCHTDKDIKSKVKNWEPWKRSHGPDWQKGHGIGDSSICKVCHKPSFCSNCHVQMPHSGVFKERHGIEAKADGKQCLNCHTSSSCNSCHKSELPHPQAFKKEHPALVKKEGKKNCSACHTDRSCNDCHAMHFYHPDNKTSLK